MGEASRSLCCVCLPQRCADCCHLRQRSDEKGPGCHPKCNITAVCLGDRRSDPFCLAGLPPWKPFLRHTPQPLRHSLYSAGCTVYITSRLRLKCRALFGPGNGYRAPPRRSTTISRVSVLTLTRGRVDAYPMRRDSNRQPALRVLGAERPARVSPSKPAVARPRRCTYVVHTRDEERAF
jgi:hypothetical protein